MTTSDQLTDPPPTRTTEEPSADSYEFPDDFFGRVRPELADLIGKVVMLAALLELKVEELVSTVSWEGTQGKHAAVGFSRNLETLRKRLKRYDRNEQEKLFVNSTESLLRDIERALDERNLVAHGLWPATGGDGFYVWKTILESKRVQPGNGADGRELQLSDLVKICERLAQLVNRAREAFETGGFLPRRE